MVFMYLEHEKYLVKGRRKQVKQYFDQSIKVSYPDLLYPQSVSCLTLFPTTYGDNSAFVQDYSRHLFARTSRNLPSLRTYRGPNK